MHLLGSLLMILFFCSSQVQAWDQHEQLMKKFVEVANPQLSFNLRKKVLIPIPDEEKEAIAELAKQLHVNPERVPVFSEQSKFKNKKSLSLGELIASGMIDEPDHGMDQDLPESDDLLNERKWMGGVAGPTSQGFRHMEFLGFNWRDPFFTFQVPLKRLGRASERFETLLQVSKKFAEEKRWFWAVRVGLWASHIMQDLHQPFHVHQVLHLRFVPWSSLANKFVARTTQCVSNYHYAYEALALKWSRESSFCPQLETVSHLEDVNLEKWIQESRIAGRKLGADLYALLGDSMKDPQVDLPNHRGSLPDPLPSDPLQSIEILTCEQYLKVRNRTWSVLNYALGKDFNLK